MPKRLGIVFCIARIRMACGDGFNFKEIDMTISMDKKWQGRTLGGKEYIIHSTNMGGVYPIHGAIKNDDGDYKVASWTSDGLFTIGNYTHPNNLIEVPEEKSEPSLDDYYAAFNMAWDSHEKDPVHTSKGLFQTGIKAVLELAGVKVL